jgi:hypothetical protein
MSACLLVPRQQVGLSSQDPLKKTRPSVVNETPFRQPPTRKAENNMTPTRITRIIANFSAIRGRTKADRQIIREKILSKAASKAHKKDCNCSESKIYATAQDLNFPDNLKNAERIIVIIIPERNTISGGILSIFSIAAQIRKTKSHHGHEVILMTGPNAAQSTYFRNTYFQNTENIYRLEQITLCAQANELYIHIPECMSIQFESHLPETVRDYLACRRKIHINILNQNIEMMPNWRETSKLLKITQNISQSVAHHAYFTQEVADQHGLPTLLLPAYIDLSAYPVSSFKEKEKLIIYSPDEAPHKAECLQKISELLPEFKLKEIRNISFDEFMELATKCMFSVTFGEGFDYYLLQPVQQGGVGFSVYNDNFFPSAEFKRHKSIFPDTNSMLTNICKLMRELSSDELEFSSISTYLRIDIESLYSPAEYKEKN